MKAKKTIDFDRALEISERIDDGIVTMKELDEYDKAMGYNMLPKALF